jgi:hypothetical protein
VLCRLDLPSRSRSKYFGAESHGNVSTICCPVHIAVGTVKKSIEAKPRTAATDGLAR